MFNFGNAAKKIDERDLEALIRATSVVDMLAREADPRLAADLKPHTDAIRAICEARKPG